MSTRRRTCATSPSEGRQEGEVAWDTPLARQTGLAHRVLRHEPPLPGDSFDSTPARGQHLSAPRERNRPERVLHGQAIRQGLAPRRAPHRGRREDGQVQGEFYTLRDLTAKGHSPSPSATFSSPPYKKKLNFTFARLEGAYQAVDRLANFVARLNDWWSRAPRERPTSFPNQELQGGVGRTGRRSQHRRGHRALFTFVRMSSLLDPIRSRPSMPGWPSRPARADAVLDIFPPAPNCRRRPPLIKERETLRKGSSGRGRRHPGEACRDGRHS